MSVGIVDPHRDASSEYYTQNYFFAWWPLTMHVCSLFYRNASTWGSSIPTYMLYFILLYYASTTWGSTIPTYLTMYFIHDLLRYTSKWGSSMPTYLSMYFILYFVTLHESVGINDPHAFINVCYSWFCCNASTWGSSIPTYLSTYVVPYFAEIDEYVGINDLHAFINGFVLYFDTVHEYVGIVDPNILINGFYSFSFCNTSTWGSTIPTVLPMLFILYFILIL